MGPTLLAQAPLRTANSTLSTAERARTQIVAEVEFEQADVREAIRFLFRKGGFGGTIAPDIQGVVTVSLRNVPWETALQNLTRQIDATYRIDHGFFEIVRRPEEWPVASSFELPPELKNIQNRYAELSFAVSSGQTKLIHSILPDSFEARNASRTLIGSPAFREVIDVIQSHPIPEIERLDAIGKSIDRIDLIVAYRRTGSFARFYRDSWVQNSQAQWQLAAREETVLNPPRRFRQQPVAKVLQSLFREFNGAYSIDPAVQGLVTMDLTGQPFDLALANILQPVRATYFIEAGVYHIIAKPER